eukprot:TRINITY_DN1330_c0_g2_i1.p1 TRINITY_DN1330_c0_g2~~TRINITY_DN1330_c0_g2_i1.p1  ORF type:complete len:585 (+),score=151.83 TRINITY_DN1330_c0_g2_i1:125-1879(+)
MKGKVAVVVLVVFVLLMLGWSMSGRPKKKVRDRHPPVRSVQKVHSKNFVEPSHKRVRSPVAARRVHTESAATDRTPAKTSVASPATVAAPVHHAEASHSDSESGAPVKRFTRQRGRFARIRPRVQIQGRRVPDKRGVGTNFLPRLNVTYEPVAEEDAPGLGKALRLPLPEELRAAIAEAGLEGTTGAVTNSGCDVGHGLNNQRQALQLAVLVAVALRRPLVLARYGLNTHDNRTAFTLGDFFDLERMRSAMHPLRVTTMEAVDNKVVFANATTLTPNDGQDKPISMAEVIRGCRPGPIRLRNHNCWGSAEWRMRTSSTAVRHWADEVLNKTLRSSLPLQKIGRVAAESMRRSLPASGGSTRAPMLHSVHMRVVGPNDQLDWPYPPTFRCEKYGLKKLPCRLMPCGCRDRGVGDDFLPPESVNWNHENRSLRDKAVPIYKDYDFVLQQRINDGDLLPGDGIFVATNYQKSNRVQRALRVLADGGVKVFFGLDGVMAGDPHVKEVYESIVHSNVQIGAAELVTAAEAEGFFVPACGSTYSDYVLELRRWNAVRDGLAESRMYMSKFQDIINCMGGPSLCVRLVVYA